MHDTPSAGDGGRVRRWLPVNDPTHRIPRITSARLLAAVFDIVVGLRLLMPDNILGNPLAGTYRLIEQQFVGDVWLGLVLLACGAAMLAGLYTDRWSTAVGAATWLTMLVWIVVAIDIAVVTVSQIGTLVYFLVAAMHGYAYAHLAEWRDQQRRDAGRARR